MNNFLNKLLCKLSGARSIGELVSTKQLELDLVMAELILLRRVNVDQDSRIEKQERIIAEAEKVIGLFQAHHDKISRYEKQLDNQLTMVKALFSK